MLWRFVLSYFNLFPLDNIFTMLLTYFNLNDIKDWHIFASIQRILGWSKKKVFEFCKDIFIKLWKIEILRMFERIWILTANFFLNSRINTDAFFLINIKNKILQSVSCIITDELRKIKINLKSLLKWTQFCGSWSNIDNLIEPKPELQEASYS